MTGPEGRTVAQVLLDSGLPQLDHLFDYAVPAELVDELRIGQRVLVPFRSQNRRSHGFVIGLTDHSDFGGELQPISQIVSPVVQLTPEVWHLARSLADRAGGSASDILRLAIPPRMVRAEKLHVAETEIVAALTKAEAMTDEPERDLASELISGARLAVNAKFGPVRLSTGEWVGGWAQQVARTALAVFATGRSVILVAPDYRDVDQLADTLSALGHDSVVRVDARQSGSSRYASFLRALDPVARIVLGNRSAIYAPAHNLGAIMVWDDSDPLLAEPLSPYVHARDAALVRAEQQQVGVVFASHQRSIEVQRLIDLNYVSVVDDHSTRAKIVAAEAVTGADAFGGRVPEFAARTIRDGLKTGPVLVQVAAAGYAPAAVCEQCGERARCAHCLGPIGFRGPNRAACRWCGEHALAWRCASCAGSQLVQRGAGSIRTAEQFAHQFSGARVVLSDGEHPVERVDSRPALIVATRGAEPIAAGGYRAVVLLDAERMLAIESLRAGEHCLRWWHNAIALAAPDARCVLAEGGGPVVQALVTGRTDAWLQSELKDRRTLRYPPAVRVASVTGGSNQVQRALQALGELPGVDVLGPTPLPGRDASPGSVRAIVRFEYAQGATVASRLRGALVADAAGSGSRVAGRSPGRTRTDSLRLRFDDPSVFDDVQ